MNKVTAIILTFNEQQHLQRCIDSVLPVTSDIVVVDSYSTDQTLDIAKKNQVRILQNAWVNNHATQFNWALDQLSADTEWILRIDADETITPQLAAEINHTMLTIDEGVMGVGFYRQMIFQGYLLRHGGMGANQTLRLFRYGHGQSESRWMDEHIKVDGPIKNLQGSIIDNNLNNLQWWLDKHENYARREAIDLLNLKYQFMPIDKLGINSPQSSVGIKRKIKEKIYAKLPGGIRAGLYYFYRFILLGGFLDQPIGRKFHYLHAFWYRNLVDIKVAKVQHCMRSQHLDPKKAIELILGIRL